MQREIPDFFSFPKLFFIPSLCIRQSDHDDLSSSKQGFQVEAEGGEEGRKGQWRSMPEAFLLLLKTEQPSRPFRKTWMSLIQIQLPCSSTLKGTEVSIVFLDQIPDFSDKEKQDFRWKSIHSCLPLIVGILYSIHDVDVIWTLDLHTICWILHLSDSLRLGQWLGEVGPTPGGSGMKGMWAERCRIRAVTTPKTQTHHVWTDRGM